MTRLATLALLGCSFLTVQAHVVRERTPRLPVSCLQLLARQANRSGQPDTKVSGLGGGTTRALPEASDPRWASAAMPSLPPRPFGALFSGTSDFVSALPPAHGAAPPILRI